MIEPGVAIKSPEPPANEALNVFACVGNNAVVMSGNATGAKGIVTGKSGRFAEHVIIAFEQDVLENLAIGDKVVVRAVSPIVDAGLGLRGVLVLSMPLDGDFADGIKGALLADVIPTFDMVNMIGGECDR
jgi:hypothetical protein